MKEIWKPVVGYEGIYSVSTLGNVRRELHSRRAYAGRLLKIWTHKSGYLSCGLMKDRKLKHWKVHQIVAFAFLGPRPVGKEINHKDGNRTNNTPKNLEYITHQENVTHAYKLGLRTALKGEKSNLATLSEDQVRAIRVKRELGYSHRKIAEMFGVTRCCISSILAGRTWRHVA